MSAALEAEAAVLSVPTLFDEDIAREILEQYRAALKYEAKETPSEVLQALRLAGVLDEWQGLMRVSAPIRDDLRARLAAEDPETFRATAASFITHAQNGFGPALETALGGQPAAVNVAVLRVLAADPTAASEPLDQLVNLVAIPVEGGRQADGIAAIRQLQEVPHHADHVERMIQFLVGLAAWRSGDKPTAVHRFTQVTTRPRGDRAEAISRHLLGADSLTRADVPRALDQLTTAVALLRGQDDARGLAQTLTTLGRALRVSARASRVSGAESPLRNEQLLGATDALEEAAQLGSALAERALEGRALLELARVEQDSGSLEGAIELAEEARDLLSRPEDSISTRVLLGGLYRDAGLADEASVVLGEAAEIASREGYADHDLAVVLNVQASADRRAGKLPQAISRARASLDIGEKLRDEKHIAHAKHTLAAALLDIRAGGSEPEAAKLLAESLAALRGMNDRRGVEMVLKTQRRLTRTQETQGPSLGL